MAKIYIYTLQAFSSHISSINDINETVNIISCYVSILKFLINLIKKLQLLLAAKTSLKSFIAPTLILVSFNIRISFIVTVDFTLSACNKYKNVSWLIWLNSPTYS